MAKEEKKWSDIQDEGQAQEPEFTSGESMNASMSDEELASLAGDMGGDGAQPDANRPRFGEKLKDDEDKEPDSDLNYDTERM